MNISISHLFSYWIFIWACIYGAFAFLYSSNSNKSVWNSIYQYGNPFYALGFGLLFDFVLFGNILWYNHSLTTITILFGLFIISKYLPLLFLSRYPLHFYKNICIMMGVFSIYLFYLHSENTNIWDVYSNAKSSIIKNNPNTPIFGIFN